MRIGRPSASPSKTQVVVVTADAAFETEVRETFGASNQIGLRVITGPLSGLEDGFDVADATVVVIDLDASQPNEMRALEQFMTRVGTWPPVVAVTQGFDEMVARTLLQMRVADFLAKPVSPVELVRACARCAQGPTAQARREAWIS